MARKLRPPRLDSARARVWAAMRNFEQRREAFTVSMLRLVIQDEPGVLEGDGRNVASYVSQMAQAGYLRRIPGSGERAWRLIRDTGPLPPVFRRKGGVIDANLAASDESAGVKVWAFVRARGENGESFTVEEIHADPGLREGARRSVISYVARLGRAGYLEHVSGRNEYVWRLVRDTGPLPPKFLSAGGVFDRNTGETYSDRRIPIIEARRLAAEDLAE